MKNMFTGSSSIINRIYLLVLTVLLFASVIVSLILWQVYAHEKFHDITLNYHSKSEHYIENIRFEIQKIRAVINEKSISKLNYGDQANNKHEFFQSLYIIKEDNQAIIDVQEQYQDPIFHSLVKLLQTQLLPVLSILNLDYTESYPAGVFDADKLSAVLLTLKQLERLHNIAGSEFTSNAKHQEGIRYKIILGIFLFIIFAASYITKNLINSIRNILKTQKNTEARLSQEKKLISTTLNSIGDAVITTDSSGLVTSMNPVAEQLTGWLNKEVQGLPLKNIFPIIDDSTREPIDNPVEKVISTGETIYLNNHTTLIAKDGKEYQISDSAAPIRDDDQILGMVLVFNDVTEQYHLRQAAAKSRKNLQAIMNNSPAVIYAKDVKGLYIFVNQKFEQLFNVKSEDVIGKNDNEIFSNEFSAGIKKNDKEVLKTQRTLQIEETFPHQEDCYSYITSKFPLYDESGNAYAVCAISTDITTRKQSEKIIQASAERLAEAQKIAHLGSWELDIVNNHLAWSDEVYRIFDIDQEQFAASYEAFLNTVHPDDRDKVNTAYAESVKNKTEYKIEHRLLMSDGAIKHVYEQCKTYYNEDGNPIRSTGTVQDVTEQVAIEEQLRRSKKMDALGKLTGGIAHDYNNLLGIIHGYSELLKVHLYDDPKLVKYANNIHRAAERGAKLTKKLLAFTRKKISDTTIFNINTILKDEQLLLEKTLTKRVQLVFDLDENLWPVELDVGDLEDAIINMCINAAYAMKSNGKLTFQTRNESLNTYDTKLLQLDAGEYVLLSITDTGCGMEQATIEKVFDPFFSTKGEQGTGLGLSQVYGFIERSGGAIKVYSEAGHGSRFVLFFPRSYQAIPEMQSPVTISVRNSLISKVILVVDDEPAMVDLAYEILTAQGYHVLTANDGNQALTILTKEKVDLIVSDVIMPNLDGYQLVKQVQSDYPHIKIQMVSGFSDDRHLELNDDSLHQNMLFKPYSSSSLLSQVDKLLGVGSINENVTGRSILIMDDDDTVRALFKLNLSKLGYEAIEACDGNEAIKLYEQSMLRNTPIDAVIMELSIAKGMGGKEIAAEILAIDPEAKMIVTSGNSEGPEMNFYMDYGFCGAMEKDFDQEKIKQVLDKALQKS